MATDTDVVVFTYHAFLVCYYSCFVGKRLVDFSASTMALFITRSVETFIESFTQICVVLDSHAQWVPSAERDTAVLGEGGGNYEGKEEKDRQIQTTRVPVTIRR